MIGLKRLPMLLLVAASLVGACGDDKKDDGDDDGDMSGDGDGDGDGDASVPAGSCDATGIFAGSTAEEVHALGMAKNKACASMTDAYQACAVNVSAAAGTAGRACVNIPPGPGFDDCVLNGQEGSIEGINDVAPALSDGCAACFLGGVNCSRMHCTVQCINPDNVVDCDKCRADNGCVDAFYECSGLPTREELGG